jgi:NitT/TauT family transport system ATP-binding protein
MSVASRLQDPVAAPQAPAAVRLSGVGKTYRTSSGETVALTGVDLTIAQGEAVVLLGPSGCGKTTLLRIVAGLETQSQGQVVMAAGEKPGQDRLGMVFQDANLFPWLRIEDNIALPLRLEGLGRTARRHRAGELADLVGLRGFERRYPRELSGGMRQRAAIARALASNPDTVLMDEPFGALDAMTRDQMNLETQRLWMQKGFTLLLVTHSITEAVFLADRVVLMSPRPGRIDTIVPVPFERPRTVGLQTTEAFQAIVRTLHKRLGSAP